MGRSGRIRTGFRAGTHQSRPHRTPRPTVAWRTLQARPALSYRLTRQFALGARDRLTATISRRKTDMLMAIEVIDGRSNGSDLAQTVSFRRRRLYSFRARPRFDGDGGGILQLEPRAS